jgi:putative ABC transport system permease protein
MSLGELLRTAIHSLRVNPIRSMLAIMGVVFGIAAVVVLISMGQGVRGQISDQIKGMGTDLLVVQSGREEAAEDRSLRPDTESTNINGSTLTTTDVAEVRKLKEDVTAATGTIESALSVQSVGGDAKSLFVKLVSGDEEFQAVRKLSFAERAQGWSYSKAPDGTCAIGSTVKDSLFGKETSDKDVLGKQIKISSRTFTVQAVATERNKSLFQDPNREVYVSVKDARDLFGAGNSNKVLEIYTKARNANNVNGAKNAITKAVDSSHKQAQQQSNPGKPYETDFFVATQDDLMASYSKILSILNALVIGVALVALAESGIGVSNIMYIAVKERTREIGVRLAQGASFRAILIQFLFESVTLCLIGAAIGVPLGWAVAALINAYTVLPAHTPLWAVLVAFLAALIVGVTAGVYPAWKATKADIAVVLRTE